MINKIEIENYLALPTKERTKYLFNLVESADDKPLGISSDYLLSLLQWEEEPLGKWHIIKALGIIKDERAVNYLITVLLEGNILFENTSLHHIAAWSIGQIGSVALRQVENALIEHQDKIENRVALVDAIGQIASPASNLILKELFLTSPYDVRQIITLAFSKIGESSIPILHELYLKSNNTIDHILLLDALIKQKSIKAYELINLLLSNSNKDEITFILNSKIDFRNPLLYKGLISLTEHSDFEIANKASEIITKIA